MKGRTGILLLWVLVAIVVVSILLALVACGPTPTATPTQPPVVEETPTQPPAVVEETPTPPSEEENILIYADPATWKDIDPRSAYSDEPHILASVYEPLVWYNPPGSAEMLSPGLATSWESNEEGTEWTFYLRQGVVFHDGTPFTAEAVKASVEATKELGLGAAWIWGPVEKIEIIDDYTVKFHLNYSTPLDLIASSNYAAWIMSPSAAKQPNEWFNEGHEAGTGPYVLESYAPGERAVLARFEDYWGGWREGQFDRIILQVVADAATRTQMIQSGEADVTNTLPKEVLPALQADPNLIVDNVNAFENWHWTLNTKRPPLNDVRVRQALAYSFPYQSCVEDVGGGYMERNNQAIPNGMLGHDDALKGYDTDMDMAARLLAEAGFPDGGFKLLLTYITGETTKEQCAVLWQKNLQQLGIDLVIQEMTWEAMWDLAKGDPLSPNVQDVGATYWWPSYITAYDFLYAMYHCEEETLYNWSYYCNPKVDELMDTAWTIETTDPERAKEMYSQAQQILLDDAVAIFIADEKLNMVLRSYIKGYEYNPGYRGVFFFYRLSR